MCAGGEFDGIGASGYVVRKGMRMKCGARAIVSAGLLVACAAERGAQTQPGERPASAAASTGAAAPLPATATAAAPLTATATAAATATPSTTPSAAPAGVSSACAACDAKPHGMCSEQTDGVCVDACLPGWAKIGMTDCGKICKNDADCAPDRGGCKPDMAMNQGVRVCDEKWMGLGTHLPQ